MPELFKARLDIGIKQIGRKALRVALRESLRFVGMFWRRTYLPIKFTRAAYRRYQYTPRGGDAGSGRAFLGSYQWKKLKGFKNDEGLASLKTTRPMVYTGRSERSGKRGQVIPRAQSAERGYVDITIPAPALNFKPAGSNVNMREEITRVTPEEWKKMEELMSRDIDKRITKALARS